MKNIEIWYHDPAEADPDHSWIGLSKILKECHQDSFDRCPYSRVLALAEYAQPDIVLSCEGIPFLSAELTRMNPSGHNLPQRFSCLVRAAELGVPSIFYYPEYSRRSNSDPNPRYLNIRVPLAQLRLSDIYNVPSLSFFWPTNPKSLQPELGLEAHIQLAKFVESVVVEGKSGNIISKNGTLVKEQARRMQDVTKKYATDAAYPPNISFRKHFPDGDHFSLQLLGRAVDPPNSCELVATQSLLQDLFKEVKKKVPQNRKTNLLLSRTVSLVYNGTPNKSKDGPEHPYPGYLTLLDILYSRREGGHTPRDRQMNLVFRLPINLEKFREKALDRPTGLNILMEFADMIILKNGVVLGGFIRNLSSGAVLIHE